MKNLMKNNKNKTAGGVKNMINIKTILLFGVIVIAFLFSGQNAFAQAPTVTTDPATSILQTSVVLNGTVNPNGDATTAWFEYNANSYGSQPMGSGTSNVAMTGYTLTGLTCGTQYSYKTVAFNGSGPTNGSSVNFTTLACASPPTVNTLPATIITETSVVLNGEVNPNGDSTIAWFEYNANSYGSQSMGSGTSMIQMTGYTLAGLTCGTQYSYKVVAVNGGGPTNGNSENFTTAACPSSPTVTTDPATSILQTSVVLNGTVNPNNDATTAWFEYNANSYGSQPMGSGTSNVAMTGYTLTGLTCNTTYSYKAVAVNGSGPTNGSSVNFTTAACNSAPTVTTDPATSILQTSVVLNGTVNPNNDATTAWFEYNANSYGSQSMGSGTSNVTMTGYTLTGLTCNTTYSYKAVAVNGSGPTNGSSVNFTTAACNSAPTVTTDPATSILQTSVVLNGTVNPNSDATTAWFEYNANSYGSQSMGSGTSNVTMTGYTLTGLTCNTTYSYKAVAVNGSGPTNGNSENFTTAACPGAPTVTTDPATSIAQTSVVLNGTVNPNGDSTTAWFEYNSSSYGSQSMGSGTSNVTMTGYTLTGLTCNTTYSYKAVANNSSGTTNGSSVNFTTSTCGGGGGGGGGGSPLTYPPTAITIDATNIDTDSATLNGTWNANSYSTETWFVWGIGSNNLNSSTSTVTQGTGNGTMGATISNLQDNTTYYFKAVAKNSYGTVYGSAMNFTTESSTTTTTNQDAPTAITAVATLKTTTSAKLNGLAVIPNAAATNGYFEWGKTVNLGTTTSSQSLGTNAQVSFSQTLTGLEPDTIYYFRAIVTNQNGTDGGDIMIFQTTSDLESGDGTSGTGTGTGTSETSGTGTTSATTTNSEIGTSGEAPISLTIETVFDDVSVGDIITYTVVYKNIGEETVNNAVLRVILPNDIDFRSASAGTFSASDNALTLNIEQLDPDQEGRIYLEGEVLNTAQNEDLLLTTATMVFTNPATLGQEDRVAYALNKVIENPNLLAAAAASSGNRLLPNTVIEWLLAILALIALVLLGRQLYIVAKKPKEGI